MQAPRWVLIWRSQGKKKKRLPFSFNLAYDRLVFNGLLFIWGTFKKRRALLAPGLSCRLSAVSCQHTVSAQSAAARRPTLLATGADATRYDPPPGRYLRQRGPLRRATETASPG
jgi:hypothetical protein